MHIVSGLDAMIFHVISHTAMLCSLYCGFDGAVVLHFQKRDGYRYLSLYSHRHNALSHAYSVNKRVRLVQSSFKCSILYSTILLAAVGKQFISFGFALLLLLLLFNGDGEIVAFVCLFACLFVFVIKFSLLQLNLTTNRERKCLL